MRIFVLLSICITVTVVGCTGPQLLHKSVLNYDETISTLERQMLLINIARRHRDIPIHFTVTSSIAATFDYVKSAGFIGTVFENSASGNSDAINNYMFHFGMSLSENPTLGIVPMQGEEFTRRILTPLDEDQFEFLVFQGEAVDMLIRLMARGIEFQNEDRSFQRFVLNRPSHTEEYKEFRKIALQLAFLNISRNLFVGKLSFSAAVSPNLSGAPSTSDITEALEKGYFVIKEEDGSHKLYKHFTGRVVITNYDPLTLTDIERQELNRLAEMKPENFILLDIRPGYPGGDFPIRGSIKLRSLHGIMDFLGESIENSPEYDVEADPRTGLTTENPKNTLSVLLDTPKKTDFLQVHYKGHEYTIGYTSWDYNAFKNLYHLFQAAVTDVSSQVVPITISK
jgi:predicted RNA binding protein YcfA (HicA-like mRNA interferase family)